MLKFNWIFKQKENYPYKTKTLQLGSYVVIASIDYSGLLISDLPLVWNFILFCGYCTFWVTNLPGMIVKKWTLKKDAFVTAIYVKAQMVRNETRNFEVSGISDLRQSALKNNVFW